MEETLDTVQNVSYAKEFSKYLAKTAAYNAAATVGIFGGLIVVGSVLEWKANRRRQKNAPTVVEQ